MNVTVSDSGDFDNISKWLNKVSKINPQSTLRGTGQRTVDTLSGVTPIDSGLTAGSWDFMITSVGRGTELALTNNSKGTDGAYNIIQGIRFGHGTGTGGYVPPNDFVTPVVDDLLNSYIRSFVRDVTK